METDTPGTIFGITQKPDGKSKTKNSAKETKTQGEIDPTYEKQDRSGDEDYQSKKQGDYDAYKITGFLLITILFFKIMFTGENSQKISYAIARQRGIKIPGDEEDA